MEAEEEFMTGAYDFGARLYNSKIARWMTTDPKEATMPQWSSYNYCYNSPLLFVDPNGENPILGFILKGLEITGAFIASYWFSEAVYYTEKAYEAKAQGDEKLAKAYLEKSGAAAEELVFDIFVGAAGLTVRTIRWAGKGIAYKHILNNATGVIKEVWHAAGRSFGSTEAMEYYLRVLNEKGQLAADYLTGKKYSFEFAFVDEGLGLAEEAEVDVLVGGLFEKVKRVFSNAAKSKFNAKLGRLLEKQVQQKYNNVVNTNEVLRNKFGFKKGEIDLETADALVEVGLSLNNKLKQAKVLAEEAMKRGKKLIYEYDVRYTSDYTLREIEKKLVPYKKKGLKVEYVPTTTIKE